MGPCPRGLLEEPSWAQHSSGTAEGQIPGGSSTSLTIIAFSPPHPQSQALMLLAQHSGRLGSSQDSKWAQGGAPGLSSELRTPGSEWAKPLTRGGSCLADAGHRWAELLWVPPRSWGARTGGADPAPSRLHWEKAGTQRALH